MPSMNRRTMVEQLAPTKRLDQEDYRQYRANPDCASLLKMGI
ncbi:MAG TPA: hypothetical protein VJ734_04840 [Nitrosospira sp.]|nr:hypothetical protein [Nitrosospira sp.]